MDLQGAMNGCPCEPSLTPWRSTTSPAGEGQPEARTTDEVGGGAVGHRWRKWGDDGNATVGIQTSTGGQEGFEPTPGHTT